MPYLLDTDILSAIHRKQRDQNLEKGCKHQLVRRLSKRRYHS